MRAPSACARSATNRPIGELRSECLREDLYFRIATVVIEIPPLRARPEDTLVLAQHFARRLSERYDRDIVQIPAALLRRLADTVCYAA